jgi:hypothetical protein
MDLTLRELASHLNREDIIFLGVRKKERERLIQSLEFDVPVNWSYEELLLFSIFGEPEDERRIITGNLTLFEVRRKQKNTFTSYLEVTPTPVMRNYLKKYGIMR